MKNYYSIDIEKFFESNETFKLEVAAFNKGMAFYVVHNDYKAQVFVLELGKLLSSNSVPIFKSKKTFNGTKLIPIYIEAYKKGREYFNKEYGITGNVLFANWEAYVKNLHQIYFHKEPITGKKGWNYYRTSYPFLFTEDKIKDYGFAAGIFFEIEELKKKYPYYFKDFDTLCGNNQIEKKAKSTKQPKPSAPIRFEDLFYEGYEDAATSFVDLLMELKPPLVDTEHNYIGRLKGGICVWIDELQRQGIIRRFPYDRTVYSRLIPQRIKGLTIDESMFGKPTPKARKLYLTDIKSLISRVKLSQNSQKERPGK